MPNAAPRPCSPPPSDGHNLLFLLGLPGTLKDTVRQLLASVEQIEATHEDPWFMLPLLYMRSHSGIEAEYNHTTARLRLGQYLAEEVEGEQRYVEALRRFASELYAPRLQGQHRYLLDASDRYYHIIPGLRALFPEARIIFVLGNPLDPLRETLHERFRGHFPSLYQHDDIYRDLYSAPLALAEGAKQADDRCFTLRETELNNEDRCAPILAQLADWLGLPGAIAAETWTALREKACHVNALGLPQPSRRELDAGHVDAALAYVDHLGAETIEVLGYRMDGLKRVLFAEFLTPFIESYVAGLPEDIVAPLYDSKDALAAQLLTAMVDDHLGKCPKLVPDTEIPQALRSQIAESIVWLGEQRFSDDNEAGALTAFRLASELDDANFRAYSNQAVICHQRGESELALSLLFKSHALNPDDFDTLASLCALLKDAGRIAEARQLLMSYMLRNPDNAEAMSVFISLN